MSFSTQLWDRITPIYDAILEQPFIKELSEGTLPQETFLFYMQQDTLYLSDYSRALALAGIRSNDNEQMQQFLDFATNAISAERELHKKYYDRFDASQKEEKSPTCFSYTNFLLSTANMQDNAVSVAALLPCFWIYQEVGMHIIKQSAPDNPYQDWIDTYAGEEFKEGVEKAIAITNNLAEGETKERRRQMQNAFIRSSQLEWMFWDSAYRKESWAQQPAELVTA